MLTIGSLFAGVGGFDIAAERAGMKVVWQSENNKHSSTVLEHHWPGLNRGDIHGIAECTNVGILAGGFPCQSYSVAGHRGGLAEDRGGLWWQFHRLIGEGQPTWVLGENVPGILSSNGGRDFTTIIKSLVQLGYGVVWRILDAQWFGVAQRRRRVFIVGHSGGQPRPEVLALSEGLSGYPKPSKETREADTPRTLAFAQNQRNEVRDLNDLAGALAAEPGMKQQTYVTTPQVRRLTPLEWQRLQNFPDDWYDGIEMSDAQKYRQMGNAVAIPVVEWIMNRIVRSQEGKL